MGYYTSGGWAQEAEASRLRYLSQNAQTRLEVRAKVLAGGVGRYEDWPQFIEEAKRQLEAEMNQR